MQTIFCGSALGSVGFDPAAMFSQLDFFRDTFPPFFRASERPIAIACFLLFTRPPFPPFPDFRVPRLRLRIALFTDFPADLPYLGIAASPFYISIRTAIIWSFWMATLSPVLRGCLCRFPFRHANQNFMYSLIEFFVSFENFSDISPVVRAGSQQAIVFRISEAMGYLLYA